MITSVYLEICFSKKEKGITEGGPLIRTVNIRVNQQHTDIEIMLKLTSSIDATSRTP